METFENHVMESLKGLRRRQLQYHKDVLRKEVELIVQHPEVLKEEPIVKTLTPWQREVMEARLEILKEIDRVREIMGSCNAAVEEVVWLARNGLLDPPLQKLVFVANVSTKKNQEKETLSRSTIMRWKKALRSGPDDRAPKEQQEMPQPAWVKPLFEILRQNKDISCHAMVRELEAMGIKAYYRNVRIRIRLLAEKIKKHHGTRRAEND